MTDTPKDLADPALLLANRTTFHLGGPAKKIVVASTISELVETVTAADDAAEPVLVLSGGSNLLVADSGFPGTVVAVAIKGIVTSRFERGEVLVTVQAGEVWDDFVNYAVSQEWVGVEALSGIPGLVGSTPIQNVGAYGQEVAQTIAQVRAFDRLKGTFITFAGSECGFGYRDSIFKRSRRLGQATGRYVVVEVTFRFSLGTMSAPVGYAELARSLGVQVGQCVPMGEVRDQVLKLRRSKAMVVDLDDHDTWSAGSFFMNPILSVEEASQLPADAPQFSSGTGLIKTSAAWLIEHAGFSKGFGPGQAKLSSKHVLAITNRGGASAADVQALAMLISEKVAEKYHVRLQPEPVLVGFDSELLPN